MNVGYARVSTLNQNLDLQLASAVRRYPVRARQGPLVILHLGDGRWWDEEVQTWRSGRSRPLPCLFIDPAVPVTRITKVVLATAHLDHDPSNNLSCNLKALCQRCHMLHDREEHQRQRRKENDRGRPDLSQPPV